MNRTPRFRRLITTLLLFAFVTLGTVSGQTRSNGRDFVSRARGRARADLSRLVVVGDSLSAGFQSGSLLSRQQQNGYASRVVRQAGVSLTLPLIAEPGVPNVLQLVAAGPPPVVAPVEGSSPGRINPLEQAFNLAVPGATVADALNARPDLPVDSLTDLVLGLPDLLSNRSRSQVELAESLQPTMIFLWIGNNDALGAALSANPARLTSQSDFQVAYKQVIDRLAATGAKLVVANIPDVTVIPFLTTAEQVAGLIGLPLSIIGARLGIASGDYVTPAAFNLIPTILANPNAAPLPASVVLTAAEAETIRAAVAGFNNYIREQARANNAAFVDVNRVTNFIDRFGYFVIVRDGDTFRVQRLTTDFLGGIFSLDGVHPTNTGYAIIANEFIKAIALRYRSFVPFVNVSRVAADDPLIFAAPTSQSINTQTPPVMNENHATDAMRLLLSPVK